MGTRVEREVVNALDEAGFRVMRSPSSGSATTRDQPDVLVGRNGKSWAFEIKYRSGDRVQFSADEIDALTRFARGFGAAPLVIVRWRGDTTLYVYSLPSIPRTRGGNYALKRDDTVAATTTLEEFCERGGTL